MEALESEEESHVLRSLYYDYDYDSIESTVKKEPDKKKTGFSLEEGKCVVFRHNLYSFLI